MNDIEVCTLFVINGKSKHRCLTYIKHLNAYITLI